MSGPWFFCNWWKCRGVKAHPHTFRECPHFNANAQGGTQ